MPLFEPFLRPGVRGFLHQPSGPPRAAIGLSHGAGSNCEAPLMVAVATAFAAAGYSCLRFDLPFRQDRRTGPPVGRQERDRQGIRLVASALREQAPGVPLYLAGHSYGGRQTSMLAAEDPAVADALLLLSYPLHPPSQLEKPRTGHFPSLRTPTLFVHGTRDPFGTVDEVEQAIRLIPGRAELVKVEKAGHGLPPSVASRLVEWFAAFLLRDDGT